MARTFCSSALRTFFASASASGGWLVSSRAQASALRGAERGGRCLDRGRGAAASASLGPALPARGAGRGSPTLGGSGSGPAPAPAGSSSRRRPGLPLRSASTPRFVQAWSGVRVPADDVLERPRARRRGRRSGPGRCRGRAGRRVSRVRAGPALAAPSFTSGGGSGGGGERPRRRRRDLGVAAGGERRQGRGAGGGSAPHEPPPASPRSPAGGGAWCAGGCCVLAAPRLVLRSGGAHQPVRVGHVDGDGRLRVLEDRVLLGAVAVERLEGLLGPLVVDPVLPCLVEGGDVALHRLVLQRGGLLLELVLVGGHRLVAEPLHLGRHRRLVDGGAEALQRVALAVERRQRPLQPLVLEDLGVGVLHLLHRGALDGEALLQRLAAAANLQLVELLELVLGQLEAGLGGGVGGLERGLRLEPAAVELAGRGLPGLGGRPWGLPELLRRRRRCFLCASTTSSACLGLPENFVTNSSSALTSFFGVALLLVDQRRAVLVLRARPRPWGRGPRSG